MRIVNFCLLALSLVGPGAPAAEAPADLAITLPATSDIPKLADLVSQVAGVSIQYNPQKLQGSVNLSVREKLTTAQLWNVFNQVLVGQGVTTVVSGTPPIYHIVPINEAPGLSSVLTPDELAQLPFAPGYVVLIHDLKHLSATTAVKALGALLSGQTSQIRTLGDSDRKVVLAAPTSKVIESRALLARLDLAGVVPEIRMVEAKRATPASLQASTLAAWAAFGRVDGNTRVAEIQVAPDGRQLALIAAASDIDALQRLVANIDSAEPVETRHYRPRFFGIDEVAGLLQQLLKSTPGGVTGIELVRDPLTSSLVITATSAQHQRIEGLLRTLDEAPANSRRQVRTFAVKHRQADEIAKVLTGLIASGAVTAATPDVAAGAAANPAAPAVPPQLPSTGTAVVTTGDNPVTVTTDSVTNSVICLGDPRALDQVQALLIRLDRRQPQVDLEVVLVTLSASEGRDLGVELAGRLTRGELTYTATSLFGLSTAPAADPIARSLGNAAGFGGVVINPGDYAGVIRALETVANGKSIIKSRVVVNNNAKATVNGVVQEPVTSINSGQQVATTTYAGTSDAGTQLTISPQISPADYITLTYTISQSAFLGDSTVSANGSVIPPTKRTDSLASVATIPDGFVIGLGGLSNRSNNLSESRLPFLGSVPLLGYLFKSQSTSESESRFYVFIRANVLRHEGFADLRRLSAIALDKVPEGGSDGPRPEPQLMK